jgi:hypothetical protein
VEFWSPWWCCAFDIDGGCTNCVLQYNYSHDNEGSGFQSGPFAGCSPLGDNTIRYNISENDAKKNTDNTGGTRHAFAAGHEV